MGLREVFLSGLAILAAVSSPATGDDFGGGEHAFTIEFVTIGAPGNPPDTTGDPNPAGAVPYVYRIGKYEISERMIDAANALGGLGITKDKRGPEKPATRVSWFEAAQFVNWLNTSTGGVPAYKFDAQGNFQLWAPGDPGYDPGNLFRNAQARYFLPSADEWYKAAFYDPVAGIYWDYPNGSDSPPLPVASGTAPNTAVWNTGADPADITQAGGPSPMGTIAQAGNVWEWQESEFDLLNDSTNSTRSLRGSDNVLTHTSLALSSSYMAQALPSRSLDNVGFRIASQVPEPDAFILIATCTALPALRRLKGRLLKTYSQFFSGGKRGQVQINTADRRRRLFEHSPAPHGLRKWKMEWRKWTCPLFFPQRFLSLLLRDFVRRSAMQARKPRFSLLRSVI